MDVPPKFPGNMVRMRDSKTLVRRQLLRWRGAAFRMASTARLQAEGGDRDRGAKAIASGRDEQLMQQQLLNRVRLGVDHGSKRPHKRGRKRIPDGRDGPRNRANSSSSTTSGRQMACSTKLTHRARAQ